MTSLQIKIAILAVAVISLICSGIWIRGVFAERAALRTSAALAQATATMYANAWNRNEQLQKEIVNAVQKIRVQSNNYIEAVEVAPPPAVPDGGTVQLVAPGVPETVPPLPGFKNYSAGRAGTAPAGS